MTGTGERHAGKRAKGHAKGEATANQANLGHALHPFGMDTLGDPDERADEDDGIIP